MKSLITQPTITQLSGVDVFESNPPVVDANFLPQLQVLQNDYHGIAVLLLPGRPIHQISIQEPLDSSSFHHLQAVCGLTTVPIQVVEIGFQSFHPETIETISRCFPCIESLSLVRTKFGTSHLQYFGSLRHLKHFVTKPRIRRTYRGLMWDVNGPLDFPRLSKILCLSTLQSSPGSIFAGKEQRTGNAISLCVNS